MTSFIEKLRIPISEIFLGSKFTVYLFELPHKSKEKIIRACIADYLEGKLDCRLPAHVYWNTSDTGDFLAVAVSSRRIGIDIETKRERKFEKISRRYFEFEKITDDMDTFYHTWTAKEAWCKWKHEGIANNLHKPVDRDIIYLTDLPPSLVGAICI